MTIPQMAIHLKTINQMTTHNASNKKRHFKLGFNNGKKWQIMSR